jgi:hypothetical protein
VPFADPAAARFHVVPEREQSFDHLCVLFDDLDTWLPTGQVATAIAWADTGRHIAFTEASLRQFRQVTGKGPAAFDDYLMTTSYEDDQATNMDW